jgi:3-oxoacyl-[acyl-carrier-protein] synthase II
VAPLGNSVDELFANLASGRSGIATLSPELGIGLRSSLGAHANFDGGEHFDEPRLRMLDRVSQFALVAANQAVADAKLNFDLERRDRCGVSVGTGMGGAQTTDSGYRTLYAEKSDRIKPFSVIAAMSNAPAAWIGIQYALSGANLTYSTACSSSAVAIGEAALRIRSGEVDIMLAGGTEAPLTFGMLRAWDAMRVMASVDPNDPTASCRPFSRNRSGLVLAEGAGFVVLEEWEHAMQRGAVIHAELCGYGLSTDSGHITRPSVEGQVRTMRAALASAACSPDEIDYVNAHGTATMQNDAIETAALKSTFGDRAYRMPVSSTKSMHGHLLGAAGALEFIICVASILRSTVLPTMHLDSRDPACDLDYVTEGARTDLSINTVMSNSFAFGGTNAVLIARRSTQ